MRVVFLYNVQGGRLVGRFVRRTCADCHGDIVQLRFTIFTFPASSYRSYEYQARSLLATIVTA